MRRALLSAAVLGALWVPASARGVDYSPVNAPGPPLTVPQADLDAALACSPGVDSATRAPVLLVHGTGSSPPHNWGWTYQPALNSLGIPWCTVALPGHGNGDIQESAEYVVSAVRAMHARAGRKIAIVGHSQGGMLPRWVLRFWPDTRAMVDDLIGFAATNHGTTMASLTCQGSCSAATWQQRDDSNFIDALNSHQETFAGVSYTEVYTHTDQVVTPNFDDTGTSSIHGGGGEITNVAIQDVCPTAFSEHLAIGTVDAVAYALAIDALDHAGPADPSRISILVCAQLLHPGINPVTFPQNAAAALIDLETSPSTDIPREPPLRCHVIATCGAESAVLKTASKCHKRKKAARQGKKQRHKRKRCTAKKKKKKKR